MVAVQVLLMNYFLLGLHTDHHISNDVLLPDDIVPGGECSYGCTQCSAVNGCLACKHPYFLYVRRDETRQYAVCTRSCPAGFYKLKRKNKQGFCAKCMLRGCRDCSTRHYCSVCKRGLVRHAGRCRKKCPDGTLLSARFPGLCLSAPETTPDFAPNEIEVNGTIPTRTPPSYNPRRPSKERPSRPRPSHPFHRHQGGSKGIPKFPTDPRHPLHEVPGDPTRPTSEGPSESSGATSGYPPPQFPDDPSRTQLEDPYGSFNGDIEVPYNSSRGQLENPYDLYPELATNSTSPSIANTDPRRRRKKKRKKKRKKEKDKRRHEKARRRKEKERRRRKRLRNRERRKRKENRESGTTSVPLINEDS